MEKNNWVKRGGRREDTRQCCTTKGEESLYMSDLMKNAGLKLERKPVGEYYKI